MRPCMRGVLSPLQKEKKISMAYAYSHDLHSYGPYSYGLYSYYGLCSHGLYSYGLYV